MESTCANAEETCCRKDSYYYKSLFEPKCGRRNEDTRNTIRTAAVFANDDKSETFAGEWPHMCTIWKTDGNKKTYVCGASLIKPNVVLTTAHNVR